MNNKQGLMKESINKFIEEQKAVSNMHRKIKNAIISIFPCIVDVRIEPITVYCYECGELDDTFQENGMSILAYTQNPQKLIKEISEITNMSCVRCNGYGKFNSKGETEEIKYNMEFIVNYDD